MIKKQSPQREYPCGTDHPLWKGGKIEVACAYCNSKLYRKRSKVKNTKNHFCNRKCMGAWYSKNNNGENNPQWKGGYTQISCTHCGKKFKRRPSMIEKDNNYFCSKKCASAWRVSNFCGENNSNWKGGLIKVVCDQCGKVFTKKISQEKRSKNNFCSHKCSGLWKAANLLGEKSYSWTGGAAKVICCQCGKEFEKTHASIRQSKKHFCSLTCKYIWQSINQSGENNPMWRNGISLGIYCPIWTSKEFKEYIFERDEHKCQNPDCWGTGKFLTRHHIDYDKKNCKPNNIITICNSCNARANSNRDWHKGYYQEIMFERFDKRRTTMNINLIT